MCFLGGAIQIILCESFPKWGYPRVIHVNRMLHYKPSMLGKNHLWLGSLKADCFSTILEVIG